MKENKTDQEIIYVNEDNRRKIEFDGNTYVPPFFTGQAVGWARKVFIDQETNRVNILLITPEDWHLWYEISMSQLKRMEMDVPEIGAPLYFLTLQKRWHKDGNLHYTIDEGWYCDEYLRSYGTPEFMKES